MHHKSIPNEPKLGEGAQAVVRGGSDAPGITVVTVPLARASERNFFREYEAEVEETRLEAKTKNTKKIQGQGQPFRGQTLSRPRTGILEATDQGHKRKCSPEKKVFKKFFRRSQKKTSLKIFFWHSPVKNAF